MALSQAMSTGITGLMTHQKAMDNIGNNLANVNTVGFKKGVYQFSTLLEQSMRGGMGADATTGRGSVNPISLGMGAETGSINKVFTQGPLENTGNPNDMAIDGNGFFVLRQGNGYVYTRAGSFYRGEDGSLMAGDGLYVQGSMAVKGLDGTYNIPIDAKLQNIVIPIGTTGGHSQTSTVEYVGNLDSRQKLSQGTKLFGGTSYPTVASLQSWIGKDFNGGDPYSDSKVDTSWNTLEQKTYAVSQATYDEYVAQNGAISLPASVSIQGNGVVADMTGPNRFPAQYLDVITGAIENNSLNLDAAAIIAAGNVPLVEEIKTINGGNVQTSAAYGVEVPDRFFFDETAPDPSNPPFAKPYEYKAADGKTYSVTNSYTYPSWFYESTGAVGTYGEIVELSNGLFDMASPATVPPTTPPTAADVDNIIRSIWPNGINGEGWPLTPLTVGNLPHPGETYPATLDTPLEALRYLKGTSTWVQPFANIKNGDEISLAFKKGDSQYECAFVYNRPKGQASNGQVPVDHEQSYTLGHLLQFMAGDVDEPTLASQNITPAMFGAPVELPDFPYGNPEKMTSEGKTAYETELANVNLAKLNSNMDVSGGAMGLLSIPPQISDQNGGSDSYDAPAESAGAYTREGVQEVTYKRWETDHWVDVKAPSFNISLVSNLGSQNALSNVILSYNDVPHETMYKGETEYASPQGGSSIVSVDFYDSLGNPKTATLRLAMVEQDSNFTTWRWYADCVDDTDFQWQADELGNITTNLNVGTGLIRFDKNGNFVKGADFSESQGITINQSNQGVNDPIWISILNGLSAGTAQDLDFSELTCTATASDLKLSDQNGRPPGTLDDFTVSLDGTITGVYSNGNTMVIGRLGLAMIPNPNGMIVAGSNLYYTGPASGDARYGHANTGGAGVIKHQQLESSNVDLSIEFTKLITTERGFQANSRTITTADEMIQELLNLKR